MIQKKKLFLGYTNFGIEFLMIGDSSRPLSKQYLKWLRARRVLLYQHGPQWFGLCEALTLSVLGRIVAIVYLHWHSQHMVFIGCVRVSFSKTTGVGRKMLLQSTNNAQILRSSFLDLPLLLFFLLWLFSYFTLTALDDVDYGVAGGKRMRETIALQISMNIQLGLNKFLRIFWSAYRFTESEIKIMKKN